MEAFFLADLPRILAVYPEVLGTSSMWGLRQEVQVFRGVETQVGSRIMPPTRSRIACLPSSTHVEATELRWTTVAKNISPRANVWS